MSPDNMAKITNHWVYCKLPMLKLPDFGTFSSAAKVSRFLEYQLPNKRDSTVLIRTVYNITHMLWLYTQTNFKHLHQHTLLKYKN
jgi:hypothetical protein